MEHLDALLGEAETRLKNKEYKDPFAPVMREPCFEFISNITKKAADEAQCDRVYTFLEKAANDASVDDPIRGLALWNIYYQRRDEKTLKLMGGHYLTNRSEATPAFLRSLPDWQALVAVARPTPSEAEEATSRFNNVLQVVMQLGLPEFKLRVAEVRARAGGRSRAGARAPARP